MSASSPFLAETLSLSLSFSRFPTSRIDTCFKAATKRDCLGNTFCASFLMKSSNSMRPENGAWPACNMCSMTVAHMAMGQNPYRTPSEHPNFPTKIGPKMRGEFTYQPKWDTISSPKILTKMRGEFPENPQTGIDPKTVLTATSFGSPKTGASFIQVGTQRPGQAEDVDVLDLKSCSTKKIDLSNPNPMGFLCSLAILSWQGVSPKPLPTCESESQHCVQMVVIPEACFKN